MYVYSKSNIDCDDGYLELARGVNTLYAMYSNEFHSKNNSLSIDDEFIFRAHCVCVYTFHMIEPNEQTQKFGFVYLLIAGQFQCGGGCHRMFVTRTFNMNIVYVAHLHLTICRLAVFPTRAKPQKCVCVLSRRTAAIWILVQKWQTHTAQRAY